MFAIIDHLKITGDDIKRAWESRDVLPQAEERRKDLSKDSLTSACRR
jgi:hypothetical protein